MMFAQLRDVARSRRDTVAISNESSKITYGVLLDRALAFREFFAKLGRPFVLLALPGGPEFTLVQLAALGAEAIHAPLPHKSTTREVSSVIDLVAPDVVVVESLQLQAGMLSALREPAVILSFAASDEGSKMGAHTVVTSAQVERGHSTLHTEARDHGIPAEVAMVQFTSGSTGSPKGVLLTQAALLANLAGNNDHLARFEGQSVFCTVPQFHAMGGAVVLEHVYAGSPTHVTNQFVPAEDVRRMQASDAVALLGSPNYFSLALRLGVLGAKHLPRLRSFTLGTAAADVETIRQLFVAYPDASVHVRYGLSESVGALTRLDLRAGDEPPPPGLVGSLVGDASFAEALPRLGDGEPKEVVVRSSCNALGQLTSRNIWSPLLSGDSRNELRTGDCGYLDDLGRLYVRGRTTTFLKVNGYRISPFEIELALRSYPGVSDVVVVGPSDPVMGQKIVAAIEMHAGVAAPTELEYTRHCQAELAAHKRPHRYVWFEQLPRTHAGKPDRNRILREIEA